MPPMSTNFPLPNLVFTIFSMRRLTISQARYAHEASGFSDVEIASTCGANSSLISSICMSYSSSPTFPALGSPLKHAAKAPSTDEQTNESLLCPSRRYEPTAPASVMPKWGPKRTRMLPSLATWLENATKPVSPTYGEPPRPPIGKTLPQCFLATVERSTFWLLISSGQKDVPSNVFEGVNPNSSCKTAVLRKCTADPGIAPGKYLCTALKGAEPYFGPRPSQWKTRSCPVSCLERRASKVNGTEPPAPCARTS
mmetsp:Transcript_11165/g.29748  ORF Transcript_11165/g.29748 Transcript_11165/m.29748 type:complete len:254 (-) Transcript_11165:388-1149(-)